MISALFSLFLFSLEPIFLLLLFFSFNFFPLSNIIELFVDKLLEKKEEEESTGNNHNWTEHRQEAPRNSIEYEIRIEMIAEIDVSVQWLGKLKTMKLHAIFIGNIQCHGACLWRRFHATFHVWCSHTAVASMQEMSKSSLAPNYNNYTVSVCAAIFRGRFLIRIVTVLAHRLQSYKAENENVRQWRFHDSSPSIAIIMD